MLSRRIDAALGRALLALFRNDAGGVRLVLQRNGQHLIRRRHFQIERQIDLTRKPFNVGIGDMSPILTQMRRDPVGPRRGRQFRRPHRIGKRAAARVADGGNVVDVHTEAELCSWLLSAGTAHSGYRQEKHCPKDTGCLLRRSFSHSTAFHMAPSAILC